MDENKLLLEDLCAHIDERIKNKEDLDAHEILNDYGLPEQEHYVAFAQNYTDLARTYHSTKNDLKVKNPDLDLERVVYNTIAGVGAGYTLEPNKVTIPLVAAGAASLTLYDELKGKGYDLTYSFWGVVIGGWFGNMSDPVLGYVGAAVGVGIGLTKAVLEQRKKQNQKEAMLLTKQQELEKTFVKQKRQLINKAVPKLMAAR